MFLFHISHGHCFVNTFMYDSNALSFVGSCYTFFPSSVAKKLECTTHDEPSCYFTAIALIRARMLLSPLSPLPAPSALRHLSVSSVATSRSDTKSRMRNSSSGKIQACRICGRFAPWLTCMVAISRNPRAGLVPQTKWEKRNQVS